MARQFNTEKAPKTFIYVLEHLPEDIGLRCNRCGSPVLRSDKYGKQRGYSYQCMACDEDLFSFETHKGPDQTTEELNQLCLNTEDLLLLDVEHPVKEETKL